MKRRSFGFWTTLGDNGRDPFGAQDGPPTAFVLGHSGAPRRRTADILRIGAFSGAEELLKLHCVTPPERIA